MSTAAFLVDLERGEAIRGRLSTFAGGMEAIGAAADKLPRMTARRSRFGVEADIWLASGVRASCHGEEVTIRLRRTSLPRTFIVGCENRPIGDIVGHPLLPERGPPARLFEMENGSLVVTYREPMIDPCGP